MSNDPKGPSTDADFDFAHEFTPVDMVSFLLKHGYTTDQIEGRIVASSGFVKDCLSNPSPIGECPEQQMAMLKNLYLREQIKSFLRVSPFLGSKKGSKKIGISHEEYKSIYEQLIGSGEVKFVNDIPDWGQSGDRKPLRKHIVK